MITYLNSKTLIFAQKKMNKSFIEDETIQSAESKIPQDKLYLPSFAVCPGTPFRNESKSMLTLEEYDENAYDPTELDVTILYVFKTLDVKYKEEILRTSVLGKCLYYEMEDKVWHFFDCLRFNLKSAATILG